MDKYESIKTEIETLIEKGRELYKALYPNGDGGSRDFSFFVQNYERWYTQSLIVVRQLLPDRLDDYVDQYKPRRTRKELNNETYTISDALRGLIKDLGEVSPASATLCMHRQVKMLQSCLDTYDNKLYQIQSLVQSDIFDSEIDSARHLLQNGFLRAAGAICGVVIEKHLKSVCELRNLPLKKKSKSPTIADYNETLKDNAYDIIEWRRMQHLADIRNLCDHSKDREPTKEEVEELISGTERVIKTIF